MTKQLSLPDETYQRLKGAADVHYRTLGAQIEWMMDFIGGKVEVDHTSHGTPLETPTPQKKFEGVNTEIFAKPSLPTPLQPYVISTTSSLVDPEHLCCKNPQPCKHWTWNGISSMWVNTLSERIREA